MNVKPEAIKLPEENIRSKLPDTGFGNHFFFFDTQSKGIKSKTHHFGFITTLGGNMQFQTKFERKKDTSFKVLEEYSESK